MLRRAVGQQATATIKMRGRGQERGGCSGAHRAGSLHLDCDEESAPVATCVSTSRVKNSSPDGPPLKAEAWGVNPRDVCPGTPRAEESGESDAAGTQVTAIGHPLALPGRLDEFLFLRRLGKGAFGYVSLVRDRYGRRYALKSLPLCHGRANQARYMEKVGREVDIMRHMRFKSRFIVHLRTTYNEGTGILYLLMDHAAGGDFWSLLAERRRMSEAHARFYLACVVEALADCHAQGIVYRDLKPENLLVTDSGYLKLTDFGLSRFLQGPGARAYTVCGTPQYIAPDIINSKGKGYDRGVDWWALGVLLFEVVCGYAPFGRQGGAEKDILRNIVQGRAHVFAPGVSEAFKDLVRRLMHPNSASRLGMQRDGSDGVRRHPFFDGFDWDALRKHTLPAPFLPVLRPDDADFEHYDIPSCKDAFEKLAAPRFYEPGKHGPARSANVDAGARLSAVPKHVIVSSPESWENFV